MATDRRITLAAEQAIREIEPGVPLVETLPGGWILTIHRYTAPSCNAWWALTIHQPPAVVPLRRLFVHHHVQTVLKRAKELRKLVRERVGDVP